MPKGTDREARVLDGSTFFVSGATGDVGGDTAAHGLFYRDTRFLSLERLTVDGESPVLLSTDEVDYFSASFFLTLPWRTATDSHPLTIVRNRLVGHGAHEDVMIGNFNPEPIEVEVALDFDCDFADLFQVKRGDRPRGQVSDQADRDGGRLVFTYRVGPIEHQTIIECGPAARLEDRRAVFRAKIDAKGWWKT